jgi:hypothetical protein
MTKKEPPKSRKLVSGYLEQVSSRVFSSFPKEVTALVGKQHGVYALYKGNRLYYVGLASNLKGRIKQHLRDKHAGKWDKFSLYLVRKADHIKELESLILRIADPKGNATKGRLPRAENLKAELKSKIKNAQSNELVDILNVKSARRKKARTKTPVTGKRSPTMAPFVSSSFRIRATYKGKTFTARVRADGRINYNGTLYSSPSQAGKAVRGRPTNGWTFWYYGDAGKWVKLKEMRK